MWREIAFDDSKWQQPVPAATQLGAMKPRSIGPVQRIAHSFTPIGQGPLAEAFGYELDDPAARFFLRDLECEDVPPQGTWRRYDLGRVRLGRASITLDVPAGAVVEIAASEQLRHGRVSPYITLSAGASCNMDHFIARGGVQTFEPLTPKGGRFLEIHILAPPEQIKFVKEDYAERTFHAEPDGAFDCGDDLLNRIWSTGVATYRACSEDAIIDNPTRERGQWLGDAIVGGEIAAAAYSDLRLMRRNLLQTAQCAREDGLVPGMTTGGLIYLSTYAALFTPGCVRYFQLTGDRSLLEDLWDPARKNLEAFERYVHPAGLADDLAPAFVDWGFDRGAGPINIPLNLHYLSALAAMGQWCRALEKNDHVDHYARREAQIRSAIGAVVDEFTKSKKPLQEFGYHSAALCLSHGFFSGENKQSCIEYLKQHILSCFPNNPDAPRNSDPGVTSRQLITPYFAHFAFGPLIEHGQMDFVLDQYRKCWGWALEDGRTTWVEVFDTRWSHCHQWSGCPTWQLSRYVLGLNPRYDRGERHFDLRVIAGSLAKAQGKVPLADGGVIDVAWKREKDRIRYQLNTPKPIVLHIGDESVAVQDKFERVL
jgi:hypothetical protein